MLYRRKFFISYFIEYYLLIPAEIENSAHNNLPRSSSIDFKVNFAMVSCVAEAASSVDEYVVIVRYHNVQNNKARRVRRTAVD